MNWSYLLTSLEGRINRKPYWLATLALLVVTGVLELLAYFLGGMTWATLVGLIFLYPTFALSVKRAHDRNLPTWLIGLAFGVLILLELIDLAGLAGTDDAPSVLFLAIVIPWFILVLFLFIELGFRRGTAGTNQYGPDPLAGQG